MIRNAEVQEASYWIPKGLIMVGMYLEAAQQEQQAQLDNEEQSFVQSISQGSTEAERRALQLKLKNAELTEMQIKLLGAKGKWKKELKKQVAKLDAEVAELHFAIRGVGKSSPGWSVPEEKEMPAKPHKGITMASSPMPRGAFSGSPVPKLAIPTTPNPAMAIDTKQLEACLETFRQQLGQEAFDAACNQELQQTSRPTHVQKDIGESGFGDAAMVECSRDTLNCSIAWISRLLHQQEVINTHREALATARARIVNNDEIEESVQNDVRCRASSIMTVDSDGFPATRSRVNTMDDGGRGRGDSVTSVDSDGFPRFLAGMMSPAATPKHSMQQQPSFSMLDHLAASNRSMAEDDKQAEPLSPAQRIKAHRSKITASDLDFNEPGQMSAAFFDYSAPAPIPDADVGFTLPSADESDGPEEPPAEKPLIFKGLQLDEVSKPEYQASISDIMKLTPRNFNNELDTYLNEVMTLTPRALTDKLDDYLAAVCTDSYALQHNISGDVPKDIGIPNDTTAP